MFEITVVTSAASRRQYFMCAVPTRRAFLLGHADQRMCGEHAASVLAQVKRPTRGAGKNEREEETAFKQPTLDRTIPRQPLLPTARLWMTASRSRRHPPRAFARARRRAHAPCGDEFACSGCMTEDEWLYCTRTPGRTARRVHRRKRTTRSTPISGPSWRSCFTFWPTMIRCASWCWAGAGLRSVRAPTSAP